MEHQTAYTVDKGIRRSNNEDRAATVNIGCVDNNPVSLLVLADGMGGHEGGEVASQMAVDTITRQISKNSQHFGGGRSCSYWLSEAFKAANQKIYSLNRARDEDMGTTLVAALVIGSRAFIANIGDSRAYQISRDGITQITTDHTLVQDLLNTGMITPEQAKNHSLRNCITQSVGTDETVDVDIFSIELDADDTLLLCSDGLTNELDDSAIYTIIQAANSTQSACETLIAAANDLGGRDNISVVLAQLKAAKMSLNPLTETHEMIGV
jgi:PPM family protein phosphatase